VALRKNPSMKELISKGQHFLLLLQGTIQSNIGLLTERR